VRVNVTPTLDSLFFADMEEKDLWAQGLNLKNFIIPVLKRSYDNYFFSKMNLLVLSRVIFSTFFLRKLSKNPNTVKGCIKIVSFYSGGAFTQSSTDPATQQQPGSSFEPIK
jgi:hypothetical protein